MKITRKISNFLSLDRNTMLLFLEAFYFLGFARIIKSIPFNKVAPTLGERMGETSYFQVNDHVKIIKDISYSIAVMSKHTWWESKCLVMAIAGMKMLERRQIESTLYMGIAREKDGNMIAHAWLRSGKMYVSGAKGADRYTVVAKFAKRMNA